MRYSRCFVNETRGWSVVSEVLFLGLVYNLFKYIIFHLVIYLKTYILLTTINRYFTSN